MIFCLPLSLQAKTLTGMASWYGKQHHGRKTASGVKFNMNGLTSAHKTMPFGTMIQVTNLSNGLSVIVKVTDRGPFIKGRILDLSKKAAETIKMDGVAKVKIKIIKEGAV